MATDTIHLHSKAKGLRVCLEGGEMDFATGKGRVPRVKRKPTFIEFTKGNAAVEKTLWPLLKAKTREEAVVSIRALPGFGADFFLAEGEAAVSRDPAEVR